MWITEENDNPVLTRDYEQGESFFIPRCNEKICLILAGKSKHFIVLSVQYTFWENDLDIQKINIVVKEVKQINDTTR
jgi:hypothetical protein